MWLYVEDHPELSDSYPASPPFLLDLTGCAVTLEGPDRNAWVTHSHLATTMQPLGYMELTFKSGEVARAALDLLVTMMNLKPGDKVIKLHRVINYALEALGREK